MMIATTAAKIGRSMKKRENMRRAPQLADGDVDAARLVVAAAAGDARPAARAGCARRLDADARRARRARRSARFFASSTLAAALPVLVGVAGDDDLRADADVRRRRDAHRAPGASVSSVALARREVDGHARRRRAGRGRAGARWRSGARRGVGHVGRRLDRRARREAHAAVDDDLVAVGEAFGDEPAVALPVADGDRPQLGLVLLVDDPDEVALGALLHRALRHHDRVGPDRADRAARARTGSAAARRRDCRPIARIRNVPVCRVVRRIGERDRALVRKERCRRPSRSRR